MALRTSKQAIPSKFAVIIGLVLLREVTKLVTTYIAVLICRSCLKVIARAEIDEGRWSSVHVEQHL